MARFGLLLSLVLVQWAICTALPVGAVLLRQSHASEKAAALGFSVIQAAIQILPLLFGFLADKDSGVRRMLIIASAVMASALCILAAGYIVAGLALLTLGYSAYKPCMQAILVKVKGGCKAWKYIFLCHNFASISSALAVGYLNNNTLWFGISVICLCISLRTFIASGTNTSLKYESISIGSSRLFPIASLIAYIVAFAPAHSSFLFLIDDQWVHLYGHAFRVDKSIWIAYNSLVAFIGCVAMPVKQRSQRQNLCLGLWLTVLASVVLSLSLPLKSFIMPLAFCYYTIIGIAEALIIPSAQAMISEDNASAQTAGVVNVCSGLGFLIVMPLQGIASRTEPLAVLLFGAMPLLVILAERLVFLRFRRLA